MSELPPLDPSDFGPFFRAVHGYDPFPWQERLAKRVVETGWPALLDLPTGTGKTAALDVAVFALAMDARRTPRPAPIRIVYVVDRRTIVDQAYDRAKKIRKALLDAREGSLLHVRDRLARYSQEGVPLRTALLRGGIARDDLWARTPDQPLIAVSTVDQVGSRLLFRGYGVSDSMKPVHAGLLGCDVLYLLDEVHLSQPFRETLAAVGRYRAWAERSVPAPFVVVEMSATPGDHSDDAFRLDESDRRNPTLSARLTSSKPVSLVPTSARTFRKDVGTHVLSMIERPGATVAVVVNRVNVARDVHQHLREVVPDATSVHLLTGRMRPFDRDALESGLLPRIRAGRTRSADDPPVIVVATQTIEAGADFDFDGLVSECASLDALRQRFGRLDRLGELRGGARGVILARSGALKDDPVYGDAAGKTWDWLQTVARNQQVDFGIEALRLPDAAGRLLAPPAHAPVLLPSHLDAWVQTSPRPRPDPDVAIWLHGPQRGLADVQIVWRAELTPELLAGAVDSGPGSEAADVALGLVEALPPVSREAMPVPFVAAKRWLQGRSEPDSFDVEGAADVDEPDARSAPAYEPRAAVLWQGEHSKIIRAEDLAPGQTIVVPASYGGIAHGNWAPASAAPVRDVAELAIWRQRRQPVLRLHEDAMRTLFETEVTVPRPGSPDVEALDDWQVVREWLEARAVDGDTELGRLVGSLLEEGRSLRVERIPLATGKDAGEYFLAIGRRRRVRAEDDEVADTRVTTEDVRSSFTGVTVKLGDHLSGVAGRASGFGERLGLSTDLVSDLRLAGEWHDAGKADPRFQRWLHGGSQFKALVQAEPLAKGSARVSSRPALRLARERAGYPAGARHELMSLVLMESAGEPASTRAGDWPLVRHVVASHHGCCRPFAPYVPDPNPAEVFFARDGIRCSGSSAHDLASFGSGVAERFWLVARKYGWWGQAWLETLLRLADHRQSESEQGSGGGRRG